MVSANISPSLYRKVTLRLMPILFISYFVNFLDRVNVGFANLSMGKSLGMDQAAFGLGAGMFFVGYFFFEVPSNLALYRFGARKWIARIVFSWGILTTLTAFIHTTWQFSVLRFLLGAAEAGFFPGMILYLTWWYPSVLRVRMVAFLLSAVAIAGLLGGPLSGWIMQYFNGHFGLEDWRWLFLIEGLPCFVLAFWIFFALPDRPGDARWLNDKEKNAIETALQVEEVERSHRGAPVHALQSLGSPTVWKLCLLYFWQAMGLYGVAFWLPSIVKEFGWTGDFKIGLLSAIPWAGAVLMMFIFGYSSDRMQERKWHAFIAALIGGSGFIFCGVCANVWGDLVGLSFGAGGVMALISISWSFPSALLSGAAAASGIALINSCGNLAGFVSPTLIGWVADRTKNMDFGLYLTGSSLFLAAIMLLIFRFTPTERR
ncbi:MAG: MFS transporter [Chthoniobacterales bacterium]